MLRKAKTQSSKKPDKSTVSSAPLTKPEFFAFLHKVTRPIQSLSTSQEKPKT